MSKNKGLVYVFTGNGKGKTSAALGVAVRAIGNGMKVGWVAWYKQTSWGLSDAKVPELVGEEVLRMYFLGEGFSIKNQESGVRSQGKIKVAPVGKSGQVVVDKASEEEHVRAAQNALKTAGTLIGEVDVLVLDEVNNAVDENLLDLSDLLELVSSRNESHVILTGRNADAQILEMADLVTEMKKIKHPYDLGQLAVKGLDY